MASATQIIFMFAKNYPALRWKVTGPGKQANGQQNQYRVASYTTHNVSSNYKTGQIEFSVIMNSDDANLMKIMGEIGAHAEEKIFKNGTELPEPDLIFGIAGGLPGASPGDAISHPLQTLLSAHGSLIVKMEWADATDPDGRPDFRFEGTRLTPPVALPRAKTAQAGPIFHYLTLALLR